MKCIVYTDTQLYMFNIYSKIYIYFKKNETLSAHYIKVETLMNIHIYLVRSSAIHTLLGAPAELWGSGRTKKLFLGG